MPHLDLANLRSCFLDDAALAALTLKRAQAGSLPVTSGRIVACDPLVQPDAAPMVDHVVPQGQYPVELIQHGGRPALAVLCLQPREHLQAESLHWQMACRPGQDIASLEQDELVGYPVNAGVGCFMDADTQAALRSRNAQLEAEDRPWGDDLIGEPDLDDGLLYRPLGNASPAALIAFSSGWGDGVYPSYWALDVAGMPVALVTDFLTIENGDGRSAREIADIAYRESLPVAERAALSQLLAAVETKDLTAINGLLAQDPLRANRIEPDSGETAIAQAIRLDKPKALSTLLQGGPLPLMPEALHLGEVTSYIAYAGFLKRPRSPALMHVLDTAMSTPPPGTAVPATTTKPSLWQRLFKTPR